MHLPAPDESLWTATLRVSLHIPGARSLKDRRRVVLSAKERAAARFAVSAAEVGHLDNPRAAVLAFAAVGNDRAALQSRLDAVVADLMATADATVLDIDKQFVAFRTDLGSAG